MYKICYLPIATKDIEEIILYISEKLQAPQAAMNLLDEMESAIGNLKDFPFAYRVYSSGLSNNFEYRLLPVKNYSVFYVVTDDIVEIHRVLYSKRDFTNIV